MIHQLYKNIRVLIAATVIVVMAASCSSNDPEVVPQDSIQKILEKESTLSLFTAAIKKAKLLTFTEGPGPFTFYAPVNSAFNAIGINTESDINNLDSSVLTTILLYHFHNGRRLNVEINAGPNAVIATQGGTSIYASRYTNATFFNGTKFLQTDLVASNGVVHTLNRVLLPSGFTVYGTISTNPSFKLFNQALIRANAVSPSFAANPFTAFVPTNAAMTAAGYDSTAIANLNTAGIATLSGILRYHAANVSVGRRFSSELRDGNILMSLGGNAVISNGLTKIKGTNNANPFNIIGTDIFCTNGVIHVIDGVLRP
jgi:uncharacterized surface protein with fasciclin (FAS1) repeats